MNYVFWISAFVILYTFFGYAIISAILVKVNKKIKLPKPLNSKPSRKIYEGNYLPKVTLIISAFSESREIIKEKISNTLALNYPKNKLEIFFAVAINKKKAVDETLDEYMRHFLNNKVETGLSPQTEELLTHFELSENENQTDEFERITELLEKLNIDSSELDQDYSQKLAEYNSMFRNTRELNWFITKDVERKGKISQVNRTVRKATGEIVVFSDANSMFNQDSILNIVKHFGDSQVGCVAGEKRIKKSNNSTSGEGEGLYWKYESLLKKIDSKLYSAMGAAGEIFAIRRDLLNENVPENAIIEDFVVSMKLVENGYRIVYEPNAYAEEEPTLDVKSEYARRARISAGGFQAILLLKKLLNPFKYRIVTFEFISHRVLRWAVVPFLLPIVFGVNLFLVSNSFYLIILALQLSFYALAFTGFILEKKRIKIKLFNLPYVFVMMNYSAYAGLKRFILGQQTVLWEKADRSNDTFKNNVLSTNRA